MSEVTTQLTVSNTDIVTMLITKNRTHLNNKLEKALEKLKMMREELANELELRVMKKLEEKDFVRAFDAYCILHRLLNPGKDLRIIYDIAKECKQFFDRCMYDERTNLKFKLFGIYPIITINNEEDSQMVEDEGYDLDHPLVRGNNEYYCLTGHIPVHVSLSVDIPKELSETWSEVERIRNLLRNESKLRDEIVANVTEKALQGTTLMDTIISDIKLIE